MTSIQPELWVERAAQALTFYQAAFGARVLHRVGDGDDIVAQLAVGEARFWITAASPERGRFSPSAIGGGTGRTLLVVDDPGRRFPGGGGRGEQPRRRRWAKSTGGGSAGSLIPSATNGRSAGLLVPDGPNRRGESLGPVGCGACRPPGSCVTTRRTPPMAPSDPSVPEGHTLHRLARQQQALFAGQVVSASSPQGRFAAGAAMIDGLRLDRVDAYGKHLLHHYEADLILHVHLGLLRQVHHRRR